MLLIRCWQSPIFKQCQTVKASDFDENSNQKWRGLMKKRHIRDYSIECWVLPYLFSRYSGLICWCGVVQIHIVVVRGRSEVAYVTMSMAFGSWKLTNGSPESFVRHGPQCLSEDCMLDYELISCLTSSFNPDPQNIRVLDNILGYPFTLMNRAKGV